jgi:hypothetical protein
MDLTTLTGPEPNEPVDLFTFQQRAFPLLLGWSLGSILAGLIWRRPGQGFWRGIGDQFIGWGLVDGLIAWFGLGGAQRNSQLLKNGQLSADEHVHQRRNFILIVALNVLLDVGYIIGGRYLTKRAENEQRRGMGWGILVQGGFLFVWDLFLLILVPGIRRNE